MTNQSDSNQLQIPDWSKTRYLAIRWQRNPRNRSAFGLQMPGMYGWVDEADVKSAFILFWRAFEKLDPTRRHTTKSIGLCADPNWDERNELDRKRIGRCFRYFAENQILPLTLVGKKSTALVFALVPTTDSRKAA